MNLKRQTSEGRNTGPVPALSTSTSSQHNDWLHEAAARFCSAITLQIPVGYEDEEGFHCGDPAPVMMETHQTVTRLHQ